MVGACWQQTGIKLEPNKRISVFWSSNATLWCVYLPTEVSLSQRQDPVFFPPSLLISVVFPAKGSGALSCPYQRAPAPRLNHRCQESRPVQRDTVSPNRHVQGLVISAGDQGECNLFDGFVFLLSVFLGQPKWPLVIRPV